MEYENTQKSYKGQAIAGLTLGIIGTGLALANNNGCGNNWLGNIFGNNCCGNNWGCGGCGNGRMFAAEMTQSKISALESEVAQLRSEKYTDYVGMDLYKNIVALSNREDEKISALQAQVTSYVIDLDKRVALNEQASRLNREYDALARDAGFKLLEQKIDCCCDKTNMRIDFNAERACTSDAAILSYVQSTYIPGTLKLPITSICPQPATETTTA